MPVARPPLEQWYEAARRAGPPAPQVANLGAVRGLAAVQLVLFAGVVWRCPPTPYLDGLRLAQLSNDYDDAAERGDMATLERVFHQALPILRRNLRPAGPWQRLKRRLLHGWRDPFKRMSNAEFTRLVGFLSVSRTRSSVVPWPPRRAEG